MKNVNEKRLWTAVLSVAFVAIVSIVVSLVGIGYESAFGKISNDKASALIGSVLAISMFIAVYENTRENQKYLLYMLGENSAYKLLEYLWNNRKNKPVRNALLQRIDYMLRTSYDFPLQFREMLCRYNLPGQEDLLNKYISSLGFDFRGDALDTMVVTTDEEDTPGSLINRMFALLQMSLGTYRPKEGEPELPEDELEIMLSYLKRLEPWEANKFLADKRKEGAPNNYFGEEHLPALYDKVLEKLTGQLSKVEVGSGNVEEDGN